VSRRSFGFWGRDLDSNDFARAVAALGVLQGNPPLRWMPGWFHRLAEQHDDAALVDIFADRLRAIAEARAADAVGWELNELPDASGGLGTSEARVPMALSRAWDALLEWQGRRFVPEPGRAYPRERLLKIEVQLGDSKDDADAWQDQLDPVWLVEQLSGPAVDVDSVCVRIGRPAFGRFSPNWDWPLSVGFLDDPESRRLRRAFDAFCRPGHDWVLELVELVEVRPENPRCELLILPYGPVEALARLLPSAARATMVLMLDDFAQTWQRGQALLAAIQAQTEASGLALCRVGPADLMAFLKGLVRQLSHNIGLDAALAYADRDIVGPHDPIQPLVFVDPRLVAESRVSLVGDRLVSRAERSAASVPDLDAEAMQGLDEVKDLMVDRHDFWFFEERQGASRIAKAGKRLREVLDSTTEPRFLQAHVFDVSDPTEPQRLEQAFRANCPHAVDVWIGPPEDGAITADVEFPDRDLLDHQATHRLTVVFTDLGLEVEPQVCEVVLPRFGRSAPCRFFLHTARLYGSLQARIVVLYGNRVLQTLLLRGPIEDVYTSAPSDERIRLTHEVMARVRLDDLSSRRKFDAALVVNHVEDGGGRYMAATDDRVEVWKSDQIDRLLDTIYSRLELVVEKDDEFFELDGQGMRDLLYDLARNGWYLYQDLMSHSSTRRLADRDARLIQIVNLKSQAHYPAEFVYDRESPGPHAVVCPHAGVALRTGACPDTCASQDERDLICPLGFWGMTKVIERVPFGSVDGELVDAPKQREYLLRCETSAVRRALQSPLTGAVLAASDVAGKRRIRSVVRALTKEFGANVQFASTWKAWKSAVDASAPSILVLIPHTLTDRSSLSTMEISKEDGPERLAADHVYYEHVRKSKDDRPIVLLLGCKTDDQSIPVASFVSAFYRRGAALVLATLTRVIGDHAAPVASKLVSSLVRLSTEDGETFGDALLKLRRQFMADGLPMVMALTYYGDADWILGRPVE
jgi:hypothetical protein